MSGLLDFLPYLRETCVKRVSSWDKTGGNKDFIRIEKGDNVTIARIKGPAIIKHIWITIACRDKYYLRKILFRAYWDGENSPSIDSPIGDFFGIGHGIAKHFISLPLTMTCDRGFNCYFPMPFNDEAVFEIVNECETEISHFYFHIDYEVLSEEMRNVGYFHAKWRRELTKPSASEVNLSGDSNYLILYAKGRGHYVGCILNVHGLRPGWWGEGDDMIFVDGEKWPPSIHGTGTEDYIGSAWGFNREFYSPFHGFPLKGPADWTGYHTMYRFHLEAPIPFRKSIRVTIEHGHANNRGDDWSSVAYWYQREPHYDFFKMPNVEARLPLPQKDMKEVLLEVLNDLKEDDRLDRNFWDYVWYIILYLNKYISKEGENVLREIMLGSWSEIYKNTIGVGDIEKAREILMNVYRRLIKVRL